MGLLEKLFGRQPSDQPSQEKMVPVRETEAKGEKRFAAVLRSPKKEGEPPELERDWEIVKIDDQTGEVTVRKEGVGKKTLSHEQFWALNFPKSGEMMDALGREQKHVQDMGFQGLKGEKEARNREMTRLQSIKEAFKAGDLGPMRDFFADDDHLARLEQEAERAERYRKEDQDRLKKEIADQDQYLEGLTRRLATEKNPLKKVELNNEIWQATDWKKSLMLKFEELKNPSPERPELKQLRDFVQILDQEISARRKKMAA